jgi:hypothetical protein
MESLNPALPWRSKPSLQWTAILTITAAKAQRDIMQFNDYF